MNKLQKLLSDLTDASTVNDEHQSVIKVEDAIEMIEKAFDGMVTVPEEPLNDILFALSNPSFVAFCNGTNTVDEAVKQLIATQQGE